MLEPFRIIIPPHFERDSQKLGRRNPQIPVILEELFAILREDPYNRTGRHDIKKLSSVKQGEGQWRIRFSVYRLRYDIKGRDIILHSLRHRREAY